MYLKEKDFNVYEVGFWITDGEHYQKFCSTFGVFTRNPENEQVMFDKMLYLRTKELLTEYELWREHSQYLTEIGICRDNILHQYYGFWIQNHPKPEHYYMVSGLPDDYRLPIKDIN